jgi:tripartite-type tricarboxylate transporter receptor subunit TctC
MSIPAKFLAFAAFALHLTWLAPIVFCPPYPTRPVRMITLEVGGGADLVARQLAQQSSGRRASRI